MITRRPTEEPKILRRVGRRAGGKNDPLKMRCRTRNHKVMRIFIKSVKPALTEKDLKSLRGFNYMLGLQHCFALERTISRKQFYFDHLGTTLHKTNKLDNQAISTLRENLEDLTLIKYRIEEKLGSMLECLHDA
jgi:hypothetical protein